MIDGVRKYFLNFKDFPESSTLGVDALTQDINSFSIDVTPCNPILQRYINGDMIKQQTFLLSGRFAYNNDNTKIIKFFDELSKWIKSNNDNNIFPKMASNQYPEKIQILSNGYLINHDGTEAKYQIQLKLIYREEEEIL